MASITSYPDPDELASLYVLDSVKGFGPQKFKQVYQANLSAKEIIRRPDALPVPGKRGEPLRKQLRELSKKNIDECRERAEKQIRVAEATTSLILTYAHPLYPKLVFDSNNPVGVLYARGNVQLLRHAKAVACVGSRKLRAPYERLHTAFAREAVSSSFTVVSGFALGADTVGHRAAVEGGGSTICVMPSGLDRPFPPENKNLWNSWLSHQHVLFVSEFPFGTGAKSLNLRKRNKLIVAFAQGVLVSQSAADGGAMNAYRFAMEQKKRIATFQSDGTEETTGNHLIAQAEYQADVFPLSTDTQLFKKWLQQLSS